MKFVIKQQIGAYKYTNSNLSELLTATDQKL